MRSSSIVWARQFILQSNNHELCGGYQMAARPAILFQSPSSTLGARCYGVAAASATMRTTEYATAGHIAAQSMGNSWHLV